MGGSRERERERDRDRDRSNGRKDNKKKRRNKSRSRSSSRSYDDLQQSSSKDQSLRGAKRSKNDSSNNRSYNSSNNNYDDNGSTSNSSGNNQGSNMNNSMQGANQRGAGGVQNAMMNGFMNQRMMSQNPAMMQQLMGQNLGAMPNMNFMRNQTPNNPMNMMMNFNMGALGQMAPMGQMNAFKMPNAPFPMMNRFQQPMRQFGFMGPKGFMGGSSGMIGANANLGNVGELDENGKKTGKLAEKAGGPGQSQSTLGSQNQKKQPDAEPFVVFKNMHLITGIVEIIQNTCISLEKANPELVFYVCKKALQEILKRLKEMGMKRIHDSTEDLLHQMERKFKEEQRSAQKESQKRNSTKEEKNRLFDHDKFNAGIENVDYMILKLIHTSDNISDIFHLIQTDESKKVDLSEYKRNLSEKMINNSILSQSDASNRLYQESLKLFNIQVQ